MELVFALACGWRERSRLLEVGKIIIPFDSLILRSILELEVWLSRAISIFERILLRLEHWQRLEVAEIRLLGLTGCNKLVWSLSVILLQGRKNFILTRLKLVECSGF